VLTNGCFDCLHTGHLKTLLEAKCHGTKLIVCVDDDDSVRQLKGSGRPLQSLDVRAAVLASLEMVDLVVPFGYDQFPQVCQAIAPQVLVKGGDWQQTGARGAEYAQEVVYIPLVPDRSTTKMLHRVLENNRLVETPS
jgi:D-beta-D-heptose 7-phosphate kinase/D-beta-D-heptose 1-phosphate adenosyltransferase